MMMTTCYAKLNYHYVIMRMTMVTFICKCGAISLVGLILLGHDLLCHIFNIAREGIN